MSSISNSVSVESLRAQIQCLATSPANKYWVKALSLIDQKIQDLRAKNLCQGSIWDLHSPRIFQLLNNAKNLFDTPEKAKGLLDQVQFLLEQPSENLSSYENLDSVIKQDVARYLDPEDVLKLFRRLYKSQEAEFKWFSPFFKMYIEQMSMVHYYFKNQLKWIMKYQEALTTSSLGEEVKKTCSFNKFNLNKYCTNATEMTRLFNNAHFSQTQVFHATCAVRPSFLEIPVDYPIPGEISSALGTWTDLRELCLENPLKGGLCDWNLGRLGELRKLHLTECLLSPAAYASIGHLSNLEELNFNIYPARYDQYDYSILSQLPVLKSLSVSFHWDSHSDEEVSVEETAAALALFNQPLTLSTRQLQYLSLDPAPSNLSFLGTQLELKNVELCLYGPITQFPNIPLEEVRSLTLRVRSGPFIGDQDHIEVEERGRFEYQLDLTFLRSSFPNLQKLRIHNYVGAYIVGWEHLPAELIELDLDSDQIISWPPSLILPSVRFLSLDNYGDSLNLSILQSFSGLETLSLGDYLTFEFIETWQHLPLTLKKLDVYWKKEIARFVPSLLALTELTIWTSKEVEDMQYLGKFPKLERLTTNRQHYKNIADLLLLENLEYFKCGDLTIQGKASIHAYVKAIQTYQLALGDELPTNKQTSKVQKLEEKETEASTSSPSDSITSSAATRTVDGSAAKRQRLNDT